MTARDKKPASDEAAPEQETEVRENFERPSAPEDLHEVVRNYPKARRR